MFASHGLFSEILCPHLQECNIPQCIFSHTTPLNITTPVIDAISVISKEDEDSQNGQRKRRKIEEDHISALRSHSMAPPITAKASGLTNGTPPAKRPTALTRAVSPPTSKRPSQTLTPKSSEAEKKTVATPVTPSVKPVIKTPAKNEVLNPRPLKGAAPATYDLRLRLLRALHDQFTRLNTELQKDASSKEEVLILSDQELIVKAKDIEEEAANQALIYSNIVKNKILVYKRMSVKQWVEEREKDVSAEKAKADALTSTPTVKQNAPPKSLDSGLSRENELTLLKELYTPITGLHQHGYVTFVPSEGDVAKAKEGVEAAQGWEVCDRCKTRFQVFPDRREEDGVHASGGICTYHWGKPYLREKSMTDPKAKRERRYRCCGEAMGDSTGCTQAASHVFKISEMKRLASVLQFENTPENKSLDAKRAAQPICIDCEMGYTVYGLELIRLTATSWPEGKEIIDVLVKPLGGILDLNSRFSGVWPTDLTEAQPYTPNTFTSTTTSTTTKSKLQIICSPQAARALLFSHLTPTTPLIGHGLENDLNATRIIHPTLIDTALLYPHKAGLPFRNGLKSLMAQYLNKNIQIVVDGKMTGHDSMEDANAAGELVRLRVKERWEQMRREGWVVVDGVMGKGKGGSGSGGKEEKRWREGGKEELEAKKKIKKEEN